MEPLLTIRDLTVGPSRSRAALLDRVSLDIAAGETVGLVGESGSGKSLTCRAILRLLPPGLAVQTGTITYRGTDLLPLPAREMESLRGKEISMILQNPMTSLNPVHRVGAQIVEPIREHLPLTSTEARARALKALELVHMPAAREQYYAYPHQLSGGMRQRVSGAIAMSCDPKLLIADEPTTALDATIQAEYLMLLREVQQRTGVAILIVTHDLGVVAELCDRVAVMYAGRVVETGTAMEIFDRPQHPYTKALMRILHSGARREGRADAIPGTPPTAAERLPGCAFANRCNVALSRCAADPPPETELGATHRVRCWHHVP
jgi:oligopeptide/dipeptide ABC transporter ATP-binding protein